MSQDPQTSQNIVITRATLGVFFGFVGFVALLFAAIAFAWTLQFSVIVVVAIAVGLLGLVLWAAIAPKEFVNTLTGRQARYGTSATFATILLLGIVTLSYIFVQRLNISFDITIGQTFTLSQTSLDVIDRIPPSRTVQITGFYTAGALAQRDLDDQFFRQYEFQSDGRVRVVYIDPIEQPAVADRLDLQADAQVFVSFLDENGQIDFDSLIFVPRGNRQERDITGAINRLINQRGIVTYVDSSNGAASIFDETDEGLSLIADLTRLTGIDVRSLNLSELTLEGGTIPDDAAAFVLARPVFQLSDNERALVEDYLQSGGSLMILADITYNDDAFLNANDPFRSYLADNYGLRVFDAVTVDTLANVQTPLDIIGYATFTEPPIGENLPDADLFFPIARSLRISEDKPATVANGRIVATSPESYAETNLQSVSETNTYRFDPETDIPGPIDIAGWAWDESGNDSRVVLIGDADFATNGTLGSGAEGNGSLFVESLAWLTGFDDQVTFGFQANPSAIPTIFVSGRQLDLIGLFTIVVMPLTVLIIGFVVWYRRSFV